MQFHNQAGLCTALQQSIFGKQPSKFFPITSKALWISASSIEKTNHHVSHSGNCLMIGKSCVPWLSKKQPTVATSSCETEYRAAFSITVQCIWLRRLLSGYCKESRLPCTYKTHRGALSLCEGVIPCYVPAHENVAYFFTKALSRENFEYFHKELCILSSPGQ